MAVVVADDQNAALAEYVKQPAEGAKNDAQSVGDAKAE